MASKKKNDNVCILDQRLLRWQEQRVVEREDHQGELSSYQLLHASAASRAPLLHNAAQEQALDQGLSAASSFQP